MHLTVQVARLVLASLASSPAVHSPRSSPPRLLLAHFALFARLLLASLASLASSPAPLLSLSHGSPHHPAPRLLLAHLARSSWSLRSPPRLLSRLLHSPPHLLLVQLTLLASLTCPAHFARARLLVLASLACSCSLRSFARARFARLRASLAHLLGSPAWLRHSFL